MALGLLDKAVIEEHADTARPVWPSLEALRLGPDEVRQRSAGIGGSDANVILSGNAERIRELWLVKRGEAEAAALSDHLPAMLGCWTEAFNRLWFEKVSGQQVGRIGEAVQCGRYEWRRCTLDGFVEQACAVWEAKHSNGFASLDDLLERYMPQLQHNMAVTGSEAAFLR